MRWRYDTITILAGSLAAFVLSLWISDAVFFRLPITSDEQSYLFQAHLFAEGKIRHPAPPLPSSFNYFMLICDEQAGWLSRYPPGHSMWLALGILAGSVFGGVALAAALGLALTAAAARQAGGSAPAVVAALLLSPYFLLTNGTLLSHTTGLAASAGMLLAYIRWQQGKHPAWAAIAGLAWSWLFLNRTYTALLIAIPFGIDALWQWARSRDKQTLAGTMLFAGSAACGIAALMLYNYVAVGHPLTMTYLYYDHAERLGFGIRRNSPGNMAVEHTLARGWMFFRENVASLDRWSFGFPGGLVVWLVLVLVGWSRRWSLLLLSISASLALGYIYFWYPGWNETGPNYYYEGFPAMLIAASLGASALWKRGAAWPRTRIAAAAILAGIWPAATISFVRQQAVYQHGRLAPRKPVFETFAKAPPRTLILVPGRLVGHLWDGNPFVFNVRGLQGPVVLARWNEYVNHALIRVLNEYTPMVLEKEDSAYRLSPVNLPAHHVMDFPISSLHRRTGTNIPHPEDPARIIRIATGEEHPAGHLIFGRHCYGYPGDFVAEFEIETEAAADREDNTVVTLHVTAPDASITNATQTLSGTHDRHVVQLPFSLDAVTQIEPMVYYHGEGSVKIAAVRVHGRSGLHTSNPGE